MTNVPMTEERLASIKEAAAAGKTRNEIRAIFEVSDRTLSKYQIKTHGQRICKPDDPRRAKKMDPAVVEKVRQLAAQALSDQQIAKQSGLSYRQVRRTRQSYNILLVPLSERPRPEKPAKPKKIKKNRNPMNILQEWKPRVATTELEFHVDRLRRKYCPVHAEHTAVRSNEVPKPYTQHTLFRVGNRRGVTVAELMAL